mmetsp:Transcript_37034/g.35758  ORF Transcript_37034/g.35758 Transcript_37034/m.35758 type:complete len:83 (-) Transcript_37034:164-412(-)
MSVEQMVTYLIEQKVVSSYEEFQQRSLSKIQEIMKLIFVTVKDNLDRKFGCFELFGFDMMLDEQLNPHLIEINTNPALFTDT